jgi:hypothetical protein
MPKYKVTSGDYQVIVEERTPRRAADMAVKVHNDSNQKSSLAVITMVEKLDRHSSPNGDATFFATVQLLEANTAGVGDGPNQYSRKDG